MKIQLLGTAAAPCWPDLFSEDEYCRKLRQWGGKNLRSRSQALVDDIHVIDFGLDSFYHAVKFGVDFSRIMDIFVTHSHDDHFEPKQLGFAEDGNFCYNMKYYPIDLYGNARVIEMAEPCARNHAVYHTLHPYDTVITRDGYRWTALPAKHMTGSEEEALNYIIEHTGKTVLYKTDSASYTDPKLWDFLSQYKFDLIITECTFNFTDKVYPDHETYPSVLKFREKLTDLGTIEAETPFWLTHIHYFEGGLSHEEAQKICDRDNITIGWDGAVIEL